MDFWEGNTDSDNQMINELITDFAVSYLSGVGGSKTDQVSFKLGSERELRQFNKSVPGRGEEEDARKFGPSWARARIQQNDARKVVGAKSCRAWGCGKECGWHSKCREAMSGFKKWGECYDLILF